MNSYIPKIPVEYIVPLNMNGLRGRMLRLPAPKANQREVLLIYGHHASLERFYSLAQVVNDYAGVTMPDLPGFGGMDSFYKIGEKPDIDTMADYLASVIKLRFRKQRFTIGAVSYGFAAVTRMLERYPEIAAQVDDVISVVGFAHHEDFIFTKKRYWLYRAISKTFSYRLTAPFFRNVILHPFFLKTIYTRTHNAKHRFVDLNDLERQALTEFEVHLWRINDVRTWAYTTWTMMVMNNCNGQVDSPVWHIYVKNDNYFNNDLVEQHLRIIFSDYHGVLAPVKNHVPNIIAPKKEAAQMLPSAILDLLKTKPRPRGSIKS